MCRGRRGDDTDDKADAQHRHGDVVEVGTTGVGVGDRVEIWDKSAWELKSAEFTSSSDTLLDRLDSLGI